MTAKEVQQNARRSLTEAKLRITQPRLAILELLVRHHGPFTIDEIHQAVEHQSVDRVTVYRCVDTFHEAGIVRRCDFADGPVRFEYQGAGAKHHHHVICRRCRKVEDLRHCALDEIETKLAKAGYSSITHSLEFFAVCARCS